MTPVLCFVDGEWPLFLPPESFEEPTDVSNLDQPCIVFGIDHEDATWRDDDVVDVASRARNAPVMKDDKAVHPRQRLR